MGLCKCPKKVVTTLFCYEHRVNVCENCLVSNHSSCIIQSYYKWLQDSEYDSKCPLCRDDLSLGECVRLTCFHVFHWNCFRKEFDGYPKTTAPAGYKCPTCSSTVFPDPRSASPVANELRAKFASVGWNVDPHLTEEDRQQRDAVQNKLRSVDAARLQAESAPPRNACTSLDFDSIFKQPRQLKTASPSTLYTIEEDVRKYRRRRPMTLRQSLIYLRRSPYCKFVFLILFTVFVLCVLFMTVIPTEFEDERAFNRIIELKRRADESRTELNVYGDQ